MSPHARSHDRAPVGWGAFAFKMLLAAIWAAALFAGAHLLGSDDPTRRIGGGLLVGLPAILWLLSVRRRARIDELEARLAQSTLAEGGWWAVSFGAMFYALQAALGDPPSATLLAVLPLGAFIFGETMTQVARLSLAGRDRR